MNKAGLQMLHDMYRDTGNTTGFWEATLDYQSSSTYRLVYFFLVFVHVLRSRECTHVRSRLGICAYETDFVVIVSQCSYKSSVWHRAAPAVVGCLHLRGQWPAYAQCDAQICKKAYEIVPCQFCPVNRDSFFSQSSGFTVGTVTVPLQSAKQQGTICHQQSCHSVCIHLGRALHCADLPGRTA